MIYYGANGGEIQLIQQSLLKEMLQMFHVKHSCSFWR